MNRSFLVLALVLVFAGGASAGTLYYDPASFLAALNSYYLEGFNDSQLPGLYNGTSSPSFTDALGTGYSYAVGSENLYFGTLAGGGSQFVGVSSVTDLLTITFTGTPVNALGGYFLLTDTTDAATPGTVTLNFSDGTKENLSTAGLTFFGYISTETLTGATIQGPGEEGQYPSLDDFYVGSSGATPEPSTIILLGAGLSMIVAVRRLRRAS